MVCPGGFTSFLTCSSTVITLKTRLKISLKIDVANLACVTCSSLNASVKARLRNWKRAKHGMLHH